MHDERAVARQVGLHAMLGHAGARAGAVGAQVDHRTRAVSTWHELDLLDLDLVAGELLERVGLTEVARRPYGKLSGGQKQRLHLAIALVGDPRVLVLDEPTTGLDAASRRSLWAIVRALLGRGRAVVLTTHDLAEADALADRVVMLHRGRILAQGTSAEVKARTASRRVRVVSRLDEAWFRARPGVADVRRDGPALEVLCATAEPLVLDVLQTDPDAHDLEVSGASLEDAFLAITPAATAAERPAVAA